MSNSAITMICLIGILSIGLFFFFQKKWVASTISISIFGLLFMYESSFFEYLSGLGSDSFFELQDFDLTEAVGFIKTLGVIFEPNQFFRRNLMLVILLAVVVLHIFFKFFKIAKWVQLSVCIALTILPLFFLYLKTYKNVSLTSIHMEELQERFNPPDSYSVERSRSGLKIVTFIGESTSAMNLSLYGYFRETTPNLDKLFRDSDNLIVFKNVFSTHVHTSPSLLEALSLPSAEQDAAVMPITSKKRIPLINVLNESGVRTHLISNQSRYGSWNASSSILFGNADSKDYSTNNKYAASLDANLDRPEELEYFSQKLKDVLAEDQDSSILLHSYIGHYYYKSQLPDQFKMPVDDVFTDIKPEYIFGTRVGNENTLDMVEKSDSSYKYLDYVLSNIINQLESNSQPIILTYFADHGDAVYAGVAHDSSRFQHEMSRIPFVIYFNNEAKTRFPDVFDQFSVRAKSSKVSSLAQFSETLLELHGIDVFGLPKNGSIHSLNSAPKDPILVRSVADGITYLNPFVRETSSSETTATEYINNASSIFKMSTNSVYQDNILCYHRSNSIAKAIRGLMVASCLELDVVVSDAGKIFVDHDLPKGPLLKDLMKVAKDSNTQLWFDAKNADQAEKCFILSKYLIEESEFPDRVMVEFPSETNFADSQIAECIDQMQKNSVTTSYYVPTWIGLECLDEASNASDVGLFDIDACSNLFSLVNNAVKSNLVSEINFDYQLSGLFERTTLFDKYPWNIWGVNTASANSIDHRKYKRIILTTNADPNSR